MKIIRTEYSIENNRPVVHLFCRDKNGKREIIKDASLKPYFYVPYNEKTRVPGLEYDSNIYKSVTLSASAVI